MCLKKAFHLDKARRFYSDIDDTPEELRCFEGHLYRTVGTLMISGTCWTMHGQTVKMTHGYMKVGDTVVVEGYDGETEVEVTDIQIRKESELGLPVERYKKIVRKA